MEEVSKLLERINASTEPFAAQMKEKYIYVKPFGGRWSNRVLINEYICLRIAKALGISIPNGGICVINKNTNIEDVIEEIDYEENIEGVAFYSQRIYNVSSSINSTLVVNNIMNKEEINSIILFDHIIYNIDRHKGNLLVSYGVENEGMKMYIIDHSHVFNLQHKWDSTGLQNLIEKQDYKDYDILDLNYKEVYKIFYDLGILNEETLKKVAKNFKLTITEKLLNEIIENIPKVWIINYNDVYKLKEYILYRLNNIDYMIEMIVNYQRRLGGV